MPTRGTSLHRPRGNAGAIVCALLAAALGASAPACVETVSLGSGVGDGGSGGDTGATTIPPWTPSTGPGFEPVTVGGTQCYPGLTTDIDGDGWTPVQGDCDDCDPDVGPDAVEMPTADGGEAKDEDCDGEIDEPQVVCDSGLALDDSGALSAARAIDLCQSASDGRWGVTHAVWTLADGGTPAVWLKFAIGHGNLERFGPNVLPRSGARMLALSTGTARDPSDPGYMDPRGYDKGFTSKPLDGFPGTTAACGDVTAGAPHDSIALELEIRAPQNADGFSFDFDFYTYELPDNVCTERDDLFVALLRPPPPDRPDGNLAFDAAGNAISVNTVTLEACSCTNGPPCGGGAHLYPCSLGAGPLLGTGFGADTSHDGDRGATGWLTTGSDVEPGQKITLRFAIQDAEDGHLDSTVLVDHFQWLSRDAEIPAATLRR